MSLGREGTGVSAVVYGRTDVRMRSHLSDDPVLAQRGFLEVADRDTLLIVAQKTSFTLLQSPRGKVQWPACLYVGMIWDLRLMFRTRRV